MLAIMSVPTLVVSRMIVLLEVDVARPRCPSSQPLSKTWKKTSWHVGVGLLDFVQQQHAVGAAADGLGHDAALAVADVAGGEPMSG